MFFSKYEFKITDTAKSDFGLVWFMVQDYLSLEFTSVCLKISIKWLWLVRYRIQGCLLF